VGVSHCHPVACRSQHMAAASAAEVSEDAGRDPFVQEHQPTPIPMVLTQTQTQSPFSLYHSHELTCRRPAITSRMICRHVSSRRFDSLRGRLGQSSGKFHFTVFKTATIGGPSTRAAQAMALVVAHGSRSSVLAHQQAVQPRSRATDPLGARLAR
jgi:hypothetical protein